MLNHLPFQNRQLQVAKKCLNNVHSLKVLSGHHQDFLVEQVFNLKKKHCC